MSALLMDLVVLAFMVFLAISERGTFTGWLATFAVIGYAFFAIIMLRRQS